MKLHKIAFNRIYRRNKAKPSQMMGYSVKVQAFLRRVVIPDFLLIRDISSYHTLKLSIIKRFVKSLW